MRPTIRDEKREEEMGGWGEVTDLAWKCWRRILLVRRSMRTTNRS